MLIGDKVEVKLLSCNRGVARLGITAPREITVLRDELVHERTDSDAPSRLVGQGGSDEA